MMYKAQSYKSASLVVHCKLLCSRLVHKLRNDIHVYVNGVCSHKSRIPAPDLLYIYTLLYTQQNEHILPEINTNKLYGK